MFTMENLFPQLGDTSLAELYFIVFISSIVVPSTSTNSLNITIFRNSTIDQPETFVDSIDKFNISSSQCTDNADICTSFGGRKLQDNYQCTCSEGKSTLGFYNNQWRCTRNSVLLQHTGCMYYLSKCNAVAMRCPLYTLPVLGAGGDNNVVYGPANGNCSFLRSKASFLSCKGTWDLLNKEALETKLTLQTNLIVGPYRKDSAEDPSLDGRVIRIPIKCSGKAWTPSQCVALKIKGKLICVNDSQGIPKMTKTPTVQVKQITIFRNSTIDQPETFVNSIDKFNISSSQCTDNADICTTFGGSKLQDGCQCTCSEKNSTIGFYNNQWRCTNNSVVRKHTGCIYYLQRLQSSSLVNSPLYTLPVLGPAQDNNFVYSLPGNCTFLRKNAKFLNCDGTWNSLNKTSLETKIILQELRAGKSLLIGPYRADSAEDPSLDGRVIRIPIKCSGQTWTPSQCVALKIKGKLICVNNSQDIPKTTTPTSNRGNTPDGSNDDETADNTAVIAGTVVGIAALVTIILVALLIIIKIKRRRCKVSSNIEMSEPRHFKEDAADNRTVSDLRENDTADQGNAAVVPQNDQPITSDPDDYSYSYPDIQPALIFKLDPKNNRPELGSDPNGANHDPVDGCSGDYVNNGANHVKGHDSAGGNPRHDPVDGCSGDYVNNASRSDGIYEQLNQDGRLASETGYQSLNPYLRNS